MENRRRLQVEALRPATFLLCQLDLQIPSFDGFDHQPHQMPYGDLFFMALRHQALWFITYGLNSAALFCLFKTPVESPRL
jgi:hypothetical protein